MNTTILSRDEFRESVFQRDNYLCVHCGKEAKDAHHIIDRKLFPDGGYYLDNGVSLCNGCHLSAEMTLLTCENLRYCAGIKNIVLPLHFPKEDKYDKWGNTLLPNGTRLKGEMFYNEEVQKILSRDILSEFAPYVKYPRTGHFPWSQNLKNDDRMMQSLDGLIGQEVVVTEKMDGENTTWYRDYYHARSLDSKNHPSRNLIKGLHAQVSFEIPEGWRICGENLYAEHSISYGHLPSYFMVFSIWNEKNECLSWDEIKEWCELLGLQTVPVLYEGIWDEELIKSLWTPTNSRGEDVEGYVVRVRRGFPYNQFEKLCGKFVRKGHVQTDEFWMNKPVVPNKLQK